MKRCTINIGTALVLSVGLTLTLLWAWGGGSSPVVAGPRAEPAPSNVKGSSTLAPNAPAAELRVCPSGCAHSSVQAAVDAADDGDIIKVAAGTYTDVNVRPRRDITTTGVVTQVVYISKTVTIRGGYTTTNWITSDPEANPTTLDAQGQGRVFYVSGDPSPGSGQAVSPTIEGLRITSGDATGQGGFPSPWGPSDVDAGGGIYVISATATISNNRVFSNTATEGVGAHLIRDSGSFIHNIVADNSGNGLMLFESATIVHGNVITNNQGTGINMMFDDTIVSSNTIAFNSGGMWVFVSGGSVISGNTIISNTSSGEGAGLCLQACADATIINNRIMYNNSDRCGGGVRMGYGSDSTFVNNVIAENQSATIGSGLCIKDSSPRLLHNTIARNITSGGGDGTGIYVTREEPGLAPSTVGLTNTILVSQSVGINVTAGNTVTVDSVLWHNILTAVAQSPTAFVVLRNQVTGDPVFLDPDGGDYHIGPGSPARDAGVEAGVDSDVDGQTRPMGWAPDIGADEYPGAALDVSKGASMALVNPGQLLTYTIIVTSAGAEHATGVLLTDTLDVWQLPVAVSPPLAGCAIADASWGGDVVCTPGTMVTGTKVVVTLTVQVSTSIAPGQAMVNTVLAGSDETANSTQVTLNAQDCHARINDAPTEYTTLQSAVDAANPGDLVKVAGVCLGVNERAGLRQQVYLDKSIAIRGGYSTADWTTSDPDASPTTLDAMGQGRVLYIRGDVNTTIQGLRITGGDATGLGGSPGLGDTGGGVYVVSGTTALVNSQIFGNNAFAAAGLWIEADHATLAGNSITTNTADFCGGLYLRESDATLSGNAINANVSRVWSGGGLCLWGGNATFSGDTIMANTAGAGGGGMVVYYAENDVILTNVVVADNQATLKGGGLRVYDSSARLLHTTFARNSGVGDGIYVDMGSSVALTNSILASHGVGISVTADNTVTVNGVLWHNTPITVSQSPTATVTVRNQVVGDPAFAADGYHLKAGSAAKDQGVDAGIAVDIDGEPRPIGAGYDLGADEEMWGVVVDQTTGGTLAYSDAQGSPTLIQVPAGAVTETTALVYTPSETATAPSGFAFAGHAFTLEAYREGEWLSGFGFQQPITVEIHYTDADVAWLHEDTLELRYWNGGAWVTDGITLVERDAAHNYAVFTISHLSQFALFGASAGPCPRPLTGVTLLGPTQGYTSNPYVFTAIITPALATQPVTYTWEPAPMTGQGTTVASFTWDTAGTYAVNVSAANCGATVSDARAVKISTPPPFAAGDGYEEDDACLQASTVLTDGVSQIHTFHDQGDVDWVAFTATLGVTYAIEARVPPTSTADVALALYDACGGTGDEHPPTFSPDVRMVFRAPKDGRYILRLSNDDPAIYGAQATYHLSVREVQPAPVGGALVIVAGRLTEDDELQANIHYVTNATYQLARDNGCEPGQIFYMAPDLTLDADGDEVPDVDTRTNRANLEYAITDWAASRVGPDQPFTLYLMDHGGYDKFYLDGAVGEVITPTALSGWLDALDATGAEVNIIVEACQSGSFIDLAGTVSEEGRMVMASTGPFALAYATQKGALFSDALLNALGQGLSLGTAFEESQWSVGQAHPDQTPWLDGDGDGTPNEAEDMTLATGQAFACAAAGPDVAAMPSYIEGVDVTGLDTGTGEIWAQVLDDTGVQRVWAVVYPPSYQPPESSEVFEAEPTPVELQPRGHDWYSGGYAEFRQGGQYRVVVYAEDEDGLEARPKEYKAQVPWRVYLPLVMRTD